MYGFKQVPVLSKGGHYQPEDGMCIMELVSFINRERFSDSPSCTDNKIAAYMQNVNDSVTDEERVKLLSVLDRMFHTGPEDLSWDQRVDINVRLQNIWPELGSLVETERIKEYYENVPVGADNPVPSIYLIWDFLYYVSASSESVDVKLAVLNRVLDVMDEVMGVKETPTQDREEIEKMLESLLVVVR